MQPEKLDPFAMIVIISIVCFTLYESIKLFTHVGNMTCILENSVFIDRDKVYKLVDKNGDSISCVQFK